MKADVTKWAPAVIAELERQHVPLPSDLILSVMHVESRGKPGLVNPTSGASGLMQVMPGTLIDFNQRHGKSYSMADMRGTGIESALKQIEVGVAVLAHYWKSAYRYLEKRLASVPIDLLSKVADLFYAAGPGATQKRLEKLSTINWAAIQSAYPTWAAMPHPEKVFAEPMTFDVQTIGKWLEGPIGKIQIPPKAGFALGVIVLMAAYWLMKKGKL